MSLRCDSLSIFDLFYDMNKLWFNYMSLFACLRNLNDSLASFILKILIMFFSKSLIRLLCCTSPTLIVCYIACLFSEALWLCGPCSTRLPEKKPSELKLTGDNRLFVCIVFLNPLIILLVVIQCKERRCNLMLTSLGLLRM